MKLIVVGSGSAGNTYLLTNGVETLVIDCGVPMLEAKKALDFQILSIVGAVVSHVHHDHNGRSHEYEAAGMRVWRPYEAESLRQDARFGNFRVRSFEAIHDVPCVGYLIEHPEMGKLLYATDTEYVKYRFRGLTAMLIETNYDERYINRDEAKFRHVITGHMSVQTAMQCIEANPADLRNVILCHLSANNGDPVEFKKMVTEIAPPGCQIDVAKPGLVVDLWRNDT